MFDLFFVILFFILFKISDIYTATFFAILSNVLILFLNRLIFRIYNKKLIISSLLIIIFGGITIILRDDIFIKLKTTVIYFIFSFLCFLTSFFKKNIFLKFLISPFVSLSNVNCYKLNKSFSFYFLFMGLLNLYIVYNFTTEFWINFKLFGFSFITLFFLIFNYIFILNKK